MLSIIKINCKSKNTSLKQQMFHYDWLLEKLLNIGDR